ncbi:hypothetical protein [Dyadobacter sp. OTU695]|uniref:hypothetical protein n=1 Tax=Dyadobacter sp. OTU695 TaxID=3043860 RepID=UPI00313D1530
MNLKENWKPFSTAFLQVMFVCSNTVMVAKENYAGIVTCSFLISLLWTMNVRAALGSWQSRLFYCAGASLGAIVGVFISQAITK